MVATVPDCILRVSGRNFQVNDFLQSSPFQPCKVWRVGEAGVRGVASDSGFNLVVSSGELLTDQIEGAIRFLRSHAVELKRLCSFPGVEEGSVLDFAIHRRDVLAQFDSFPVALVRLAAEFKFSLTILQYAAQTDHVNAS